MESSQHIDVPGPLARFLDEVDDWFRQNGHFRALCPVCGARRHPIIASVGESERDGAPVGVITCQAGCETEEILEALGLGFGDLREDGASGRRAGRQGPKNGRGLGEIEKTYDYVDPAGDLILQVVRYKDPKDFRQRRPNGRGGWIYSVEGVDRVLYRLPAVLSAPMKNIPVFLCEGEKDADRANEELSERVVATTAPQGSKSWARGDYAPMLRGAHVVLIPDNDDAGREHMRVAGADIKRYAKSVKLLELPGVPEGGGDLSDFFDRGGTVEELLALIADTPDFEGIEDTSTLHTAYIRGEVMKRVWRPPLEAKRMREVPDPGPRRDIVEGIIPELEPTNLHGAGGTTKSYLGVDLIMSVVAGLPEWFGHKINGRRNVLFIDLELNEAEQRRRAARIARGRGIEIPAGFFHLSARGYSPQDVFTYALEYCDENDIELVLIDSVGLAMLGDAGRYTDVVSFHRDCLDIYIASGVTPVQIDHQAYVQAGESYQSKSAYGSSYKHNLARSRLQLQPQDPPAKNMRAVILRQPKSSVDAEIDPIKLFITFEGDVVRIERQDLDEADILDESTISQRDRFIMALADGPMWPGSEDGQLGAELGWTPQQVSNISGKLRSEGLVQRTGNHEGNRHELRLSEDGEKRYRDFLSGMHKRLKEREEEDEDPDPDRDPEPPGAGPPGGGPPAPGAAVVDIVDDAGVAELASDLAGSEEIALDLETMPPAGWIFKVAGLYKEWRRSLKNKPKRERMRAKWQDLKNKIYKRYAVDPDTAEVSLLSIVTREGIRARVDATTIDLQPLLDAMQGKTLVAHNASFDVAVLRERYGYIHEGRILDTSLLYVLYHYAEDGELSEKQGNKYRVPDPMKTDVTLGGDSGAKVKMTSLAHVASRFVPDVALGKDQQASDWSIRPLAPEQLDYAIEDVDILFSLLDRLLERLNHIEMGDVVELESRALPAKIWMERNGMPVDVEVAREMGEKYAREAEKVLEKITALVSERAENALRGAPPSWSNPAHIRAALEALGADMGALPKTEKSGTPSTSESALRKIKKPADAARFVEKLLEWKALNKRVNDFVKKYPELAREDGTIAAAFETVSTGRYNCTRPNLQQVPTRGELQTLEGMRIRDIFRAPAGFKLVIADFEQVELLLAATIAERVSGIESEMLKVFKTGGLEGDIHRATAAAVLGKAPSRVSKSERSLAKSINFGLVYGCSAKRLLASAVEDYKVENMTLRDAERYRATFFKKYPEFAAWHEKVDRACRRNKGYSTTPLGRRRKLPRWVQRDGSRGGVAFTTAVNSPVQGAGADAMKFTLALLFERRRELLGELELRGTVHDETLLSAAEGAAESVAERVREIMAEAERLAVRDPESPIAVDVGVADSWGEK